MEVLFGEFTALGSAMLQKECDNSITLHWMTGVDSYNRSKKFHHRYAQLKSIRIAAWCFRVRKSQGCVNEMSQGHIR